MIELAAGVKKTRDEALDEATKLARHAAPTMFGFQKRTLVVTGVVVGTVAAVMYIRRRRASNSCTYELLMDEDSRVGFGWGCVGVSAGCRVVLAISESHKVRTRQ